MKSLNRTIAQFVFYAVAIVLFAWTASLTYSFVAMALPEMPWFVPALALVVFDVGMFAWMVVFLSYAEGSGQRSIAILSCVLDMIGVALLVLAEILLGGQQLATAPEHLGEYAIWGIALWTVANVIAVVSFHLLAPEARKAMAIQAERDAVFDSALEMLTEKRIDNGAQLAGVLSHRMFEGLKADLVADGESNRPKPLSAEAAPPRPSEVPEDAPPGSRWVLARIGGKQQWVVGFPPRNGQEDENPFLREGA